MAPSGNEILQRLKAHDAQFDRVLVEYDFTNYEVLKRRKSARSGTLQLEVHESVDRTTLPSEAELFAIAQRYIVGGPIALDKIPEKDRKWVRLLRDGMINFSDAGRRENPVKKVTSRDQFCLIWPDLAVRKVFNADVETKYSVIDQKVSTLFPIISREREWFHSEDTDPAFPNVYQEQAIWLKFALGVGYSDVIGKITDIEVVDGIHRLSIDVDYFSQLSGKGTLLLDKSLIVRDADVSFGKNRVLASNSGKYDSPRGNFSCATTSKLIKSRGSKEEVKFDLALHSIEFGITDAKFVEIAGMETPANETRYEVEEGGVRKFRGKTVAE